MALGACLPGHFFFTAAFVVAATGRFMSTWIPGATHAFAKACFATAACLTVITLAFTIRSIFFCADIVFRLCFALATFFAASEVDRFEVLLNIGYPQPVRIVKPGPQNARRVTNTD